MLWPHPLSLSLSLLLPSLHSPQLGERPCWQGRVTSLPQDPDLLSLQTVSNLEPFPVMGQIVCTPLPPLPHPPPFPCVQSVWLCHTDLHRLKATLSLSLSCSLFLFLSPPPPPP
eukprot:Sspe_Gene.22158::Locus_8382_Transcript_1_1_Confidence_1.000_Length_730::g.22158::m.22158